MRYYHNVFPAIIDPTPLFQAWEEFRKGKRGRPDVQEFERNIEENTFTLHRELRARTYHHGPYHAFTICDPKQRSIHKASVRDRILHHAVFTVLNPLFEPTFYAHSYSCRKGKGTHRAMKTLHAWLRQVSGNGHRPCFALQCDIHKFFDSVSHDILLALLGKRVKDPDVLWLLEEIIRSYRIPGSAGKWGGGVPIGNLTSQLFANVYLNEFDQYMKHVLRVRHYVRYTDDFVIVSSDRGELERLLPSIRTFLGNALALSLHPRKVTIRKFRQGIDFLGYVLLPRHRVLRTRTKRRMLRKMHERIAAHHAGLLTEESVEQSLQSYLGVLSHANTYRLSQTLRNQCWFWMCE